MGTDTGRLAFLIEPDVFLFAFRAARTWFVMRFLAFDATVVCLVLGVCVLSFLSARVTTGVVRRGIRTRDAETGISSLLITCHCRDSRVEKMNEPSAAYQATVGSSILSGVFRQSSPTVEEEFV
jgi:hypothetical protein